VPFTSSLVFGKVVTVESKGRDRYGRPVDVILPDGRSLSQELVRARFAWWFRCYAPNDTTLATLEADAREAKRGLWQDPKPVPPWEWRAGKGR
jgi:micrococcal nuclease